jgi:hypothetical protein
MKRDCQPAQGGNFVYTVGTTDKSAAVCSFFRGSVRKRKQLAVFFRAVDLPFLGQIKYMKGLLYKSKIGLHNDLNVRGRTANNLYSQFPVHTAIKLCTHSLGYGLDDWGSIPNEESDGILLAMASIPALRPTQSPTQWVLVVLAAGVKRPGREADHSPPSSV